MGLGFQNVPALAMIMELVPLLSFCFGLTPCNLKKTCKMSSCHTNWIHFCFLMTFYITVSGFLKQKFNSEKQSTESQFMFPFNVEKL